MLALTRPPLAVACVIAWLCLSLVSAVRVFRQFRAMGRPKAAVVWFVVTLLLSAIPFLVYALFHRFGWLFRRAGASTGPTRCPHCHALLEVREAGEIRTCSRCGMAVDEVDVA